MESLRFNSAIRPAGSASKAETAEALSLLRSEFISEEGSQNGGQDKPPPKDEFFNSEPSEEDLTLEEEASEGQRHQEELLEKHPIWPSPSAYEQLDRALAALRHACLRPDIDYAFEALDTQRPLASSCTNGVVFFSRSLLENLSPNQILYFAAHEIAHTELRHFATRARRLSDLRLFFTAPPGSTARLRMEQAAVLTVQHQEEFEADHQAASWLDFELGQSSLTSLASLCRRLSPDSLNVPTHPTFSARLDRLAQRLAPPDTLEYIYSLLG